MILATAAFLTLLGGAAFVLGAARGYAGVAVIGAVVILGVGSMVVVDGLAYKSGERVERIDNSTTVHTNTYRQIDTPTRLPLGALVMLIGGLLAIQGLNDVRPGGPPGGLR
jgi:hypothetical protein